MEKARRHHERRQPYEAVVCEAEHPQYVVSVADECVSVFFMDKKLRCYMEYGFQEKQPGILFLTHALFREFADDSADVLSAKTFAFKENGQVLMEDRNLVNGTVEEREATFSVQENWEDYPPFGDYTGLCREQRSKPT